MFRLFRKLCPSKTIPRTMIEVDAKEYISGEIEFKKDSPDLYRSILPNGILFECYWGGYNNPSCVLKKIGADEPLYSDFINYRSKYPLQVTATASFGDNTVIILKNAALQPSRPESFIGSSLWIWDANDPNNIIKSPHWLNREIFRGPLFRIHPNFLLLYNDTQKHFCFYDLIQKKHSLAEFAYSHPNKVQHIIKNHQLVSSSGNSFQFFQIHFSYKEVPEIKPIHTIETEDTISSWKISPDENYIAAISYKKYWFSCKITLSLWNLQHKKLEAEYTKNLSIEDHVIDAKLTAYAYRWFSIADILPNNNIVIRRSWRHLNSDYDKYPYPYQFEVYDLILKKYFKIGTPAAVHYSSVSPDGRLVHNRYVYSFKKIEEQLTKEREYVESCLPMLPNTLIRLINSYSPNIFRYAMVKEECLKSVESKALVLS